MSCLRLQARGCDFRRRWTAAVAGCYRSVALHSALADDASGKKYRQHRLQVTRLRYFHSHEPQFSVFLVTNSVAQV